MLLRAAILLAGMFGSALASSINQDVQQTIAAQACVGFELDDLPQK